jgi:exonuclease VII large subunit
LAGQALAAATDAPLTPVANITKLLTNQHITVQATISNIRLPTSERAPYVVTLTEGGASTPLVYWSDLQTQLGSKMNTGNVIRAKVTVSTYRDQIQLRIRGADAIEVVSAAPVPATSTNSQAGGSLVTTKAAPTATTIGKIKGDWADRVVVISGTISGSEKIDQGQRLSVQDASGEIQVVLEEKALTGLAVTELQPGRALTVTGPVKLSGGKPVIIPDAPGALKLALP